MKLWLTALFLLLPFLLMAKRYYISPDGKDSHSGLSPATAWRSIGKVNTSDFKLGDSILFKGGGVFKGNLYFKQAEALSGSDPLVISSYGTGRAIIEAGNNYGLYVHNRANFSISNLHIKGSGPDQNKNHGILFYNELPGDVKLKNVLIDQVEVEGFRKSGITIGASKGNSGYSNVRITNAVVHNIGSEGINVWGYFDQQKTGYAHNQVYVGYCYVYDVKGLSLPDKHSGSGIILSDVDDGTIEHSVVHSSGSGNTHCGGPVGIWAWDANNIKIQFNEAYNISAGSGCDGGGFDLDGGVTNSVMQYNYSHDNDGAGFLIAQFEWARPMHNNTIRFNISENDGRKNGYNAITLWVADTNNGGNNDLYIYNNTIYADKAVAPSGGGIYFKSPGHRNVQIYNNIFYMKNGAPFVKLDTTAVEASFLNNVYFHEGDSNPQWIWGDSTFTSLQDFQNSTLQEIFDGRRLGLTVNPQLKAPGKGGTLGYPLELAKLKQNYALQKNSPLVNKGLDLRMLLGLSIGDHDFFGNKIDGVEQLSIGAHVFISD